MLMKVTTTILFAALAVIQLSHSTLFAATVGYWRHEEGTAGSQVPTGTNTVFDATGVNHMQTFSATTGATYTTTVSPLELRSGLPNTLALDFGPGGDSPGLDDDNFTSGKPIHTYLFTAMTVELSFNMQSVGPGQYQALFAKDGKPLGDEPGEPDSPIPPFKIMVRGDDFPDAIPNQVFVEWIDGDEDIHILAGGETVVPGEWYHVAFTLSAANAELWIAGETGDYTLRDAISGGDFADEVSGSVGVFEPLGYTIGRGFHNNSVTDWSDAIIDEVRIGDAVLTPDQFLFETVDAPTEDADFDDDGDVDGQDFLVWQRGLGVAAATPAQGDADDDDDVDANDLAIWRSQFGEPAATAIPEPATIGLGLAAVVAAAMFARRRKTAFPHS
jgi:hypothetical protein